MRKLLLLTVILLLALQPISAQELLQLDELTSGELTTAAPTASYFVALKSGQALHLQVVGAATGLIPQAALNTATGALVQSIPNLDSSPNLEADLTATADGIFRLDISSLNGATGKFVLLLQAITPPEPNATLSLDQPTSDTLNPNATVVYALSGNPASRLILSVSTTDPQASLDAQLLSATGAVVASFETQADGGSQLIIPARNTSYQLKLNNPQPSAVDYEITLMALDGLISTPVPPTSAPPTNAATPLPTEFNCLHCDAAQHRRQRPARTIDPLRGVHVAATRHDHDRRRAQPGRELVSGTGDQLELRLGRRQRHHRDRTLQQLDAGLRRHADAPARDFHADASADQCDSAALRPVQFL